MTRRMTGTSVRRAAALIAVMLAATAAAAEPVLFPTPLHIVRRVEDPITRRSSVVGEYCSGNRITSLAGTNVTTIDFARGEVVDVDRAATTYSVTTFKEIANASRHSVANIQASPWKVVTLASRTTDGGRLAEVYEATKTTTVAKVTVEISIDRHFPISHAAVEALIGSSYPNRRSDIHDAILEAAAPKRSQRAAAMSSQTESYGLPVDETVTFEAGGEKSVSRTTVLLVDSAPVPPAALVIPPGASRVESRLTRFAKELERLDTPAARH
jgi:hypothetical protein